MSFEAINWAITVTCVPAPARHVLLLLANAANSSHRSWLSVSRLVAQSGLGERTVRRALEQLRSHTLITVTEPAIGIRPATYSLAMQGGQSGTPASQAPLPIRHPTPATQAATPATQAARVVTQAPNPYEPLRTSDARARDPDGARPSDRDQSLETKSATLSRQQRLAMLPPDIARKLLRSSPSPSNGSANAALAEIERRRAQARSLLASSTHQAKPLDNHGVSAESVTISAQSHRDATDCIGPSDASGPHDSAGQLANGSKGRVKD